MKRGISSRLVVALLFALLAAAASSVIPAARAYPDRRPAPTLPPAEELPVLAENTAPGLYVSHNSTKTVSVDYTNASSGYVMVAARVSHSPKLIVRITTPSRAEYNYPHSDISGEYQAFPLTEGDGVYTITVFQNLLGTRYKTLHSLRLDAVITDALSPFLRPNALVRYKAESKCVAAAAELCAECEDALSKAEAVYGYVHSTVALDREKGEALNEGYVPEPDRVLDMKSGGPIDHAALMTAMLRTQGVPTKLTLGAEGQIWLNVYTGEEGWREAVIFFDGDSWHFSAGGIDGASGDYVVMYVY